MQKNILSTITVNYGTDCLAIKCIESLISLRSELLFKICVFDNKIDTVSKLENYLNKNYRLIEKTLIDNHNVNIYYVNSNLNIIYINSDTNLGFSLACNISHNVLSNLFNCKYYYLINSDCLVAENSIDEIIKMADANPNVVYSSKVLDPCGEIWFEGGVYNKLTGTTRHVRYAIFQQSKEKFLSGCAILLSASIISKVGFFDPNFFLYGEDLDFSIRLQRNGYKVDICNRSLVIHSPGSSSVKRSYTAYNHYVTNTLGCFFKNFSFVYYPTIFFYHFMKFTFLNLMYPRNFKNNMGYIRGMINAKRKFI